MEETWAVDGEGLRVLFVHGLEGHPNGTKVQVLREQGFDVVAEDMQMSLWQFAKTNSALRNLFRLGEVRVLAIGLGCALTWSVLAASWMFAVLSSVAIAAWIALRRHLLFGKALGRSFDSCVAIQRAAVHRIKPEVVIGSSWGGAVAAELACEGAWKGPLLLLAPAIERACVWTRRGDLSEKTESLRTASRAMPVIIAHDPEDEVVPHADSVRLAEASNIELRSPNGGGHRLLDLLHRGEIGRLIKLAHSKAATVDPAHHE